MRAEFNRDDNGSVIFLLLAYFLI